MTKNKNIKGNYDVRTYLEKVFRFVEHQETKIFGLSYILPLTRNTDNAVLNKSNATNNAKNKNNTIEWCVPHYTTSLEQCIILRNQVTKNIPTELHYPERSVFMKEMNTQNFWTFELGV